MNVVLTIILAVQMLSALGMVGLILAQHGYVGGAVFRLHLAAGLFW